MQVEIRLADAEPLAAGDGDDPLPRVAGEQPFLHFGGQLAPRVQVERRAHPVQRLVQVAVARARLGHGPVLERQRVQRLAPLPSRVGALQRAAEAEVEELLARRHVAEGLRDGAVLRPHVDAGFLEHGRDGRARTGQGRLEEIAHDQRRPGHRVGAARLFQQPRRLGQVRRPLAAVAVEFGQPILRQRPLLQVRRDDALNRAVLAVPALGQRRTVQRQRGRARDPSVGQRREQLHAVVERRGEHHVIGLVLLRVADVLVRRGESQPVQLARVVGRHDRVLRLAREDEPGRIGAISASPPVARAGERELLAGSEHARYIRSGPARTLDVSRIRAPAVAVLGGRLRARDPSPGAGMRLQQLDIRAEAGHPHRARVGRLD